MKYFIKILLVIIFVLIVYFSTAGIETDRFNTGAYGSGGFICPTSLPWQTQGHAYGYIYMAI